MSLSPDLPCVIIDLGSRWFRGGLSTSLTPQYIYPSYVWRPRSKRDMAAFLATVSPSDPLSSIINADVPYLVGHPPPPPSSFWIRKSPFSVWDLSSNCHGMEVESPCFAQPDQLEPLIDTLMFNICQSNPSLSSLLSSYNGYNNENENENISFPFPFPLSISETLAAPQTSRAKMSEFLFECYDIPAVTYGIDALYSAFSQGIYDPLSLSAHNKDSMIISTSHSSSFVLPIVNHIPLYSAAERTLVGGSFQGEFISKALHSQNILQKSPLTDDHIEKITQNMTVVASDFGQFIKDAEKKIRSDQIVIKEIQLEEVGKFKWEGEGKGKEKEESDMNMSMEDDDDPTELHAEDCVQPIRIIGPSVQKTSNNNNFNFKSSKEEKSKSSDSHPPPPPSKSKSKYASKVKEAIQRLSSTRHSFRDNYRLLFDSLSEMENGQLTEKDLLGFLSRDEGIKTLGIRTVKQAMAMRDIMENFNKSYMEKKEKEKENGKEMNEDEFADDLDLGDGFYDKDSPPAAYRFLFPLSYFDDFSIKYPLLNFAETDVVDEEQGKQRRHQRLMRSGAEARLRAKEDAVIKAEQKGKKAEERRKLMEEDPKRAITEFETQRINLISQLPPSTAQQYSISSSLPPGSSFPPQNSRSRLRLLSKIDSTEQEDFGANDDDWEIYRAVATDSDEENGISGGVSGSKKSETDQIKEEISMLDAMIRMAKSKNNGETQEMKLDSISSSSFPSSSFPSSSSSSPSPSRPLPLPPGPLFPHYDLFVTRCRAGELLFHPNLGGVEEAGIAESVRRILKRIDHLDNQNSSSSFSSSSSSLSLSSRLCSSLYLCGGNSLLPGLSSRLVSEIRSFRPIGEKIKLHKTPDSKMDCWKGQREYLRRIINGEGGGPSSVFTTKKQYLECGPSYFSEHKMGNLRFDLPEWVNSIEAEREREKERKREKDKKRKK